MKLIATLLLVGAFASAEARTSYCQNEFQSFLSCSAGFINNNYRSMEDNYENFLSNKMDQCFASSRSEAQSLDSNGDGKCVLSDDDKSRDLADSGGLLRGCRICVKVASIIRAGFLKTTKQELQCIKDVVVRAVEKEVEPCIANKVDFDFRLPKLPDLDAGIADIREQMIRVTSKHMVMHSRLQFCGKNSGQRYANSKACVERVNPFVDHPQLCQMDQQCSASAKNANSPNCAASGQFEQTREATCDCIGETNRKIRDIMSSVRQGLEDVFNYPDQLPDTPCNSGLSSQACRCVNVIKKSTNTGYNNWLEVANEAFTTCGAGGSKPKIGLSGLLELGCKHAVATGNRGRYMDTIFTFLEHFVDALTHRVTRFCNRC